MEEGGRYFTRTLIELDVPDPPRASFTFSDTLYVPRVAYVREASIVPGAAMLPVVLPLPQVQV